jgi:hypothetical protein
LAAIVTAQPGLLQKLLTKQVMTLTLNPHDTQSTSHDTESTLCDIDPPLMTQNPPSMTLKPPLMTLNPPLITLNPPLMTLNPTSFQVALKVFATQRQHIETMLQSGLVTQFHANKLLKEVEYQSENLFVADIDVQVCHSPRPLLTPS